MPKAGGSIILLLTVLSLVGCTTAEKSKEKTFSVRGYLQDEARVDQQISGKIGNWENAPDAVDIERKKTRQVYYLELTKEADEADKTITEVEETTNTETNVPTVPETDETPTPSAPPQPKYDLPTFDDEAATPTSPTAAAPTGFKQYKVEKDDTLQKISMKFYNTNNKWPQIYEANKDVIKNPNFIKPGITIRIPAL